jgi:hypothetical protein
MTVAEKVELGLLPALAVASWLIAPILPSHVGIGELLVGGSALLLFQSLVRDLWLLASSKRKPKANPERVARCMCVESTVGTTGIVIGFLLLNWKLGKQVAIERWGWSLLAILFLGAGFLIKDYVLELKPWRIRKDKDHVNIIVRWKS